MENNDSPQLNSTENSEINQNSPQIDNSTDDHEEEHTVNENHEENSGEIWQAPISSESPILTSSGIINNDETVISSPNDPASDAPKTDSPVINQISPSLENSTPKVSKSHTPSPNVPTETSPAISSPQNRKISPPNSRPSTPVTPTDERRESTPLATTSSKQNSIRSSTIWFAPDVYSPHNRVHRLDTPIFELNKWEELPEDDPVDELSDDLEDILAMDHWILPAPGSRLSYGSERPKFLLAKKNEIIEARELEQARKKKERTIRRQANLKKQQEKHHQEEVAHRRNKLARAWRRYCLIQQNKYYNGIRLLERRQQRQARALSLKQFSEFQERIRAERKRERSERARRILEDALQQWFLEN